MVAQPYFSADMDAPDGERESKPAASPSRVVGSGGAPAAAKDERTAASLSDLIARAEAAVDSLAQRVAELGGLGGLGSPDGCRSPVSEHSGPLALAALAPVDRLVTALGLARAGLVAIASHHAQPADLDGERNFTAWRARTTREGHTAAQAQVSLAQALEDVPGLSEAVGTGQITLTHASVLADGLHRAEESVRGRLTEEAASLIETARRVPPHQLRRELDARRTAIEAEQADHTFAAVRAARHLRLRARNGGINVEGFLDPIAGATLREALDALTPAPAVDDERSSDQRRADALTLLAERTLSLGAAKTGAQIRPHLSILIREDTWLLLTHRRRIAAEGCATPSQGGATPGQSRATPGQATREAFTASGLASEPPLAQLLDGTLLPFAALDVLACDAFVQRVVLDPTGAPIDLGRTERTYIKDARRAILVRDRHCQRPGCTLRATWCEVHHLTWWSRDGETNQINGITLCKNHHHVVHDRGVLISPTFGGFTFTHSDGTSIGETTRLHDTMLVPSRPQLPPPAPPAPPPPQPIQETGIPPSRAECGLDPSRDSGLPRENSRSSENPHSAGDADLPDDCPALLW